MTAILHKIGVIGAYFTNGYHNTTSGSLSEEYAREYSWPQRLAKLCGITALHFGHAGWNCKKWLNSSLYTAVAETENKCTAYVVSFASNDIYEEDNPDRDYQLGTISDVNIGNESQNAASYYGYLSKIIARLYEVQPKAYVFLQTYPYNYGRTETLGYSQAMRDIVAAYRNENYRIYLIDYSTYGMTIAEAQSKNMYRGSHYVASGYQYMAYELCTYIDWIIRSNMADFEDAAFVGTNAEYIEE